MVQHLRSNSVGISFALNNTFVMLQWNLSDNDFHAYELSARHGKCDDGSNESLGTLIYLPVYDSRRAAFLKVPL